VTDPGPDKGVVGIRSQLVVSWHSTQEVKEVDAVGGVAALTLGEK